MKKFTILSVSVLFLSGIAMAASNVGQYLPSPAPADNGGPDNFGYSWTDNDGGGGPDYEWIDITGIGIEVTGLADDNNVGTIPMGFDFPYYWYSVDHMWIGSNGYISFSSSANFAHPFANIPYAGQPNDLVAVLGGDLDFTRGGTCYYYTNNADTFIVSWIAVPPFSPPGYDFDDSTHTFQLILSAADSTLKFQYGENHGDFSESGNLADVIGIEDEVGRVGLQYLRNNSPSNHMWHDGLAIVFHPEPDPNFTFHDFGIQAGFNETSGAEFIHNGDPYSVRVLAKNYGTEPENGMQVRCTIRRGTSTVYADTIDIEHLDAGEGIWATFDSPFTPSTVSAYRTSFSAVLSGDQNPANNSHVCELDAYELPQVLFYCDSLAEDGRSWNGDFSGFGVEYQVPQAIEVTGASFNVFGVTSSGPAYVWFFPDLDGHPDVSNPLAGDTVNVTAAGWVNLDFGDADLIFGPNEKFYMVAVHAFQNTFSFSMDQTSPLSYRGWEYTGGLAPDRDREISDVMFRISADATTGFDEDPVPMTFSVDQNYPNPFNARTNLNFAIDRDSDVRIGVYNVVGQLVNDLSGYFKAGENSVSWNASDFASGVYFYRISVGDDAETRKMVLIK